MRAVAPDTRPRLVLFLSARSGACRRLDEHLASVLQHRHNHDTFRLHRIDVDTRSDLAARFRVTATPTLVVVEQQRTVARLVGPSTLRALQTFLQPWLK